MSESRESLEPRAGNATRARPTRAAERTTPPALARAWSRRDVLAWTVAAGACSWLVPDAAQATSAEDDTFGGRVDAARAHHGLPGLAVAVVGPQWFQCASSGVRALDADVPILHDDAWPLAGQALVVTAALITRLVERGALSWTTTLGETLGYQLNPAMHPDYRAVTLEQLVTHRAGLPAYDDPNALRAVVAAMRGDSHVLRQRMLATASVLGAPPVRAPGSAEPAWSAVGYLVATTIVESLLDQPFERLLADEFALGTVRASTGDVSGHLRRGLGWRVESHDALPWGHGGLAPAGSLALPVRAYARVLQSLVTSPPELARSAAREPARPALGPYAGWQLGAVDAVPTLAHAAPDPRGYTVFALAQPSVGRAVVVWANAARPGLGTTLAGIAREHLPAA